MAPSGNAITNTVTTPKLKYKRRLRNGPLILMFNYIIKKCLNIILGMTDQVIDSLATCLGCLAAHLQANITISVSVSVLLEL
jgi:hypothetical protein